MSLYYIIPETFIPNVAKIHGLSMGVITDVLICYADRVESDTVNGAVAIWMQTQEQSPETYEVWDQNFNKIRQGLSIGAIQ